LCNVVIGNNDLSERTEKQGVKPRRDRRQPMPLSLMMAKTAAEALGRFLILGRASAEETRE
jgi:hypothetical protein